MEPQLLVPSFVFGVHGERTFTGSKGVSKVWKCKKYSVQGLREARFM